MATLIPQTVQYAMVAKQATVLLSTLTSGSDSIATGIIPVMLPSSFTPATAMNAQPSTGRNVDGLDHLIAAPSMLQPSALTQNNQPFVDGPGLSPVPAKLVSQVVGKYINLCNPLPAKLQLKEPEPQLLLNNHLVWTLQPKKRVPELRKLQPGQSYSSNPFPSTLE